jgi:hypothetical protein
MADEKNERLVCFLDLLGFSNFVRNNSIKVVLDKFHSIFTAIFDYRYKELTREITSKVFDLRNKNEIDEKLKLLSKAYSNRGKNQKIQSKEILDSFISTSSKIDYLIMSDSIVVFSDVVTKSNQQNILHDFVSSIKLLFSQAFLHQILLRGAISYGDFYVDKKNSIFFGKALLDAIELEGKQQWIGCSLCKNMDSIVAEYFKSKRADFFGSAKTGTLAAITGSIINKYNVPFNDGSNKEQYIINWVAGIIHKVDLNDQFFESEMTGNANIDRKYINTINYWNWWKENSLKNLFGNKFQFPNQPHTL